jgi:ubiquinone/menaquinone biosynthesis C-methylase UbiE
MTLKGAQHGSGDADGSASSDREIAQSMRRYYEDVAPEYELIYRGVWPAGRDDPSLFRHDADAMARFLGGLAGPDHLDLACGTGYWLTFYHPACRRITLVDQAESMLDECRKKVAAARISDKAEFIRADIFSVELPRASFDSVLLGFLWSHLTPGGEANLFQTIKNILRPGGRLLLIDSAWSADRALRHARSGLQTRTTRAGKNYTIRKRYLDQDELNRMATQYTMTCHTHFSGKAFMLSELKFKR